MLDIAVFETCIKCMSGYLGLYACVGNKEHMGNHCGMFDSQNQLEWLGLV